MPPGRRPSCTRCSSGNRSAVGRNCNVKFSTTIDALSIVASRISPHTQSIDAGSAPVPRRAFSIIAGADAAGDALLVDMHHAFKQANGYSKLEISRKRSALENVLTPETVEAHRQRLRQAGFQRADVWFQCFNFMSLVASA